LTDGKSRIESELEVRSYLQNLKYALDHDAQITFQEVRQVDQKRAYTIAKLFPNENPADALRRELKTLTVKEYMRTVKDLRFSKRSEMREFGKVYNDSKDLYIKIRVELLSAYGKHTAFVMSFHFAAEAFSPEVFPYGEHSVVIPLNVESRQMEMPACPVNSLPEGTKAQARK
jgi:hypothetical protein